MSDAFDIIVCEEIRNVSVRLRWCDTIYLSSRDVLSRYQRAIGRIIRLPLISMVEREVWLREPQDVRQQFLFTHDHLIESREDGTIYYRPVLPVPVADGAESSPDSGGNGEEDGPCPDMDP